jgi:hypothetical protein
LEAIDMAESVEHRGQIMTASGIDVLVGLWLIISPWVLAYHSLAAATTNDVIFGIIIAVLAASRFFGAYDIAWPSWVNVVLGVWILVSPWFLGYSMHMAALWNNVFFGIAVIVLAGWSALTTNLTDMHRTA